MIPQYEFWLELFESKGFEYVVEPKLTWQGWHYFQRGDFKIGFKYSCHGSTHRLPHFPCRIHIKEMLHFDLWFQNKIRIEWLFDSNRLQEILSVIDAMANPMLWPLCINFDWSRDLVSRVLEVQDI